MAECLEYADVYGPITTDTPDWTGGARSLVSFTDDCFFGWEVTNSSVGVVIGLNGADETTHYSEIEHGFYFTRGTYDIVELGSMLGIGPIPYLADTRFYTVRIGSDILYCVRVPATLSTDYFSDPRYPGVALPGYIIWVSAAPSFGTVFLDSSFYAVGDTVLNETAGAVWFVGVDDTPASAESATATLLQPFEVFATGTDDVTDAAEGGAALELVYSVTATGTTAVGADTELPFNILIADIPLDSLIRAEQPYTVSGSMSAPGEGVFTSIAGITGFILFEVSAVGTENNVYVQAELPFSIIAFGSSAGQTLSSGMNLTHTFDMFMTSSGGGFAQLDNGALLDLPFEVFGTGSSPTDIVVDAGALLEMPYILAATGSDDDDISPDTWAFTELEFSVFGIMAESAGNYFAINLSFNAAAASTVDLSIEVSEFIWADTDILSSYALQVFEGIQISTAVKTFYQISDEVSDAVLASSVLRATLVIQIAEAIGAADSVTIVQAVELAESLVATGQVQTFYQAFAAITSAVLVVDAVLHAESTTVAEAAGVSDLLAEAIQLMALLTDGVGVADTLQNVLTITVLENAEVAAADTLELTAQYFANLFDVTEVMALIKTPAELAQGWVMNTEGAMPISEYDNYTFNSLAYSPDEMLGCTDQGIYTLDGEDDAGTDIAAAVTSLMLDFNTSKLKRMSTAYVGYTSNGQLLLKIRSVDQGLFVENWYEGRNALAQTPPAQNRMKIGKGLRSRYWVFELVNIDGSDFELDKVELYPIVLQRRI